MKNSTYLLFAGLMVLGLFLTANPALADMTNDGMPHHDINSGDATNASGQCTNHMVDPTTVAAGTQYFKLCVAYSGATEWAAEIRKEVLGSPLICQMARVKVTDQDHFQCGISTAGTYRGLIYYWVNGIQGVTHIDRRFTK